MASSLRSLRVRPNGVNSDPQSFDRFAKRYERRDQATGGFVTDWLDGVLNGRSGGTAIDLGCGTGNVAAMLAKRYTKVRAIDISQPMIDLARRKYPNTNIAFEQGDVTEVSGQYDLVVSIMVLHHVPDLPATLQRISELVAPGGLAVLVDAAGPSPGDRSAHNRWAFLTLLGDTRRAWRRFRANTDHMWVDHLLSDEFLTPVEFHEAYGSALPGAVVQPTGSVYSAVWQRPVDPESSVRYQLANVEHGKQ